MKNKSIRIVDQFYKKSLLLIISLTIAIGFSVGIFQYSEFLKKSEHIEEDFLADQKSMLMQEVENVSEIVLYNKSRIKGIIRERIKSRVYDAHNIATNIYNKYHKKHSKKFVINLIKESLRAVRFFDNRGYYFASNLQGINQLFADRPKFEGRNVFKIQDGNKNFVVQEFIKIVKAKKEGFHEYPWSKPGEKGFFNKIAFVKYFKPYDWFIGTGDYQIEVEREIKKGVLKRIEEIKFGDNGQGYIFALDFKGEMLTHRTQPELVGKNLWDSKDANGFKFVQEQIRIVKKNEKGDFIRYNWRRSNNAAPSPKISFVKGAKGWDFYFGAGIYLDEIKGQLAVEKNKIKNKLIIQIGIILILSLITILVLLSLAKREIKNIGSEVDQFVEFFKIRSQQASIIDSKGLKFLEFQQMAKSANSMLQKLHESEKQKEKYELQIRESQKRDVISQIVGGIAHDFNNILGVVVGYGCLLTNRLEKKPELKIFSETIVIAAQKGADLTEKLLSATRKETSKSSIYNINALIHEQSSAIKGSLTSRVDVDMQLSEELMNVNIDRNDFDNSILSICLNSMQAMEDGFGNSKVTITTDLITLDGEEKEFKLPAGEYIKVSICDNGCGIAPEIQGKIFDPFFSTKEPGEGIGLSLSQVFGFMERTKGGVHVKSELGEGTCIDLIFPKTDEKSKMKIRTKEIPSNLTGVEVILVVDDEAALKNLTVQVLKEQGFEVLSADSGFAALKILEKEHERIDLLLSDVIMPNMDGDQLVEHVMKFYPNMKIQLISGYSKSAKPLNRPDNLHKNLLRKPYTPTQLKVRVREILNEGK